MAKDLLDKLVTPYSDIKLTETLDYREKKRDMKRK
jgi:hypothetical protein